MATVTIVQRVLPHYRVPFFTKLFEQLKHDGIDLKLIYGQEFPGTVPKSADLQAVWSYRINNTYLKCTSIELVWQPCLKYLTGSDLVIVEQANRLLLNYVLLFRRRQQKYKLAYWGHGRNMQSRQAGALRERVKRRLAVNVDWWFAYTQLSAETVVRSGFPRERVTTVQNAVDTRVMDQAIRAITVKRLHDLKSELGIQTDMVCLYCGGMYPDKKLDFLIEACVEIRSRVPDFQMICIGDGPEQRIIEQAAVKYPWLHYVGPKYGVERIPYFMISQAMLMPGLVGLAIVDSFAASIPLFTTDIQTHSPEIAYLENEVNGVMTSHSKDAYASAVVEYLRSSVMQAQLKEGCARSAGIYTLDNMVGNFAQGIKRCLAM